MREKSSNIKAILRLKHSALIAPVLVAGAIGAVATLGARESDPAFELRQQRVPQSQRRELEQVLRRTDEPVPRGRGSRAVVSRCRPRRRHNGWWCSVRYASGHTISYVIVVRPSGSFRGESPDGHAAVSGVLRPEP